ncbi:UNVERIFIED_CONTAM: hypothetical protein HDU68_000791 [Siphonaria sp. JEL0065]|nr:hypothetical protein HDU68_000791 [Siphonaria sp. JEL0065]
MSTPATAACFNTIGQYNRASLAASGKGFCSQAIMDAMIPYYDACSPVDSFYGFKSGSNDFSSPLTFQAYCWNTYQIALSGKGLPVVGNGVVTQVVTILGPVQTGSSGNGNSKEDSGSNTMIYVGAGAGVVVLIGIVAAVWFCKKPKQNNVNSNIDLPPVNNSYERFDQPRFAPVEQSDGQGDGFRVVQVNMTGVLYQAPGVNPGQPEPQQQLQQSNNLAAQYMQQQQQQQHSSHQSVKSDNSSFAPVAVPSGDYYAPVSTPVSTPPVAKYLPAAEEKRAHRLNQEGGLMDMYSRPISAAPTVVHQYDQHSVAVHRVDDNQVPSARRPPTQDAYAPVAVAGGYGGYPSNTGYAPVNPIVVAAATLPDNYGYPSGIEKPAGGEYTSSGYNEKLKEAEKEAATKQAGGDEFGEALAVPPPAYTEYLPHELDNNAGGKY